VEKSQRFVYALCGFLLLTCQFFRSGLFFFCVQFLAPDSGAPRCSGARSPGLPNGLKGLQPMAHKAEGPQSQDKKISHRIWSPSRHAVLHLCAVHSYCRLSSRCSFHPRGASSARVIAIIVCLCVCLSVCVSHAGIVFKRLNVGSGSCK